MSVTNLNVGGRIFTTMTTTLTKYPESLLGVMFSERHDVAKDVEGRPFLDMDPELFSYVLAYLRLEVLPPRHIHKKLHPVVNYLNIIPLLAYLESQPDVVSSIILDQHRESIPRFHEIRSVILKTAKENSLRNHLYKWTPTGNCRFYIGAEAPIKCSDSCIANLLDVTIDQYRFSDVYINLFSVAQFIRDDFTGHGFKVRLAAEQCLEHKMCGDCEREHVASLPPLAIAVFTFEFPRIEMGLLKTSGEFDMNSLKNGLNQIDL